MCVYNGGVKEKEGEKVYSIIARDLVSFLRSFIILFIVVEVDMCCFLIGKSVTFLLFSTKDVSLQWRSKKERGRESIFHRSKGFNVFS